MQRRDFIKQLASMSLLATLPSACGRLSTSATRYISAAKDAQGFAVFALDAMQQVLWRFALPERAHAASISPDGSQVIITGRRPATQSWLLYVATGELIQPIRSEKNRHFFGHSIFDPTGRFLYSTENNTQTYDGLVVVRDLYKHAQVVNEFFSGGIGPHELLMLPNTQYKQHANLLVVANGGIKTAAGSREKLNLDSMQPNLSYVDAASGKLIQSIEPKHHQMSIRHIAARQDGLIGIGVQFKGEKTANIPLILTHHMDADEFTIMTMPQNNWLRFNQYIGSVAINSHSNQLCATSPRGNCVAVVDLAAPKQPANIMNLPDGCGVVNDKDGFILSNGFGHTSALHSSSNKLVTTSRHQSIHWDNHMTGI